MHLTTIILKNGRKFCSPIKEIKIDNKNFENSYIILFDYNKKFYVRGIQGALTEKDRSSTNKIEDIDEIERMKKLWKYQKLKFNF